MIHVKEMIAGLDPKHLFDEYLQYSVTVLYLKHGPSKPPSTFCIIWCHFSTPFRNFPNVTDALHFAVVLASLTMNDVGYNGRESSSKVIPIGLHIVVSNLEVQTLQTINMNLLNTCL